MSSFNSTSQLESYKIMLQQKIGVSSSNCLDKGIDSSSLANNSYFNLLSNLNYELGNSGWIPTGTVFTPLPVVASPASSWAVVNDGSGRTGPWTGKHIVGSISADDYYFNSASITCIPGEQFVVSGYAKSGSAGTNGTMFLSVHFYDATGANLAGTGVQGSVAGGNTSYQLIQFSATTPANAVTCRIKWRVNGHTAAGTAWYVDDCKAVFVVPSTALNIGTLGVGPNGTLTVTGVTFSITGGGPFTLNWTAGFVSYQGILYPITTGSTTLMFAYWQISSPTVFSASSFPIPSLGVDDFLVAQNNGAGQWSPALNFVRSDGARFCMIGDSIFGVSSGGVLLVDVVDGSGSGGSIEVRNSSGTVNAKLNGPDGKISTVGPLSGSASAGSGGSPPATVQGYLVINVNGVDRKFAYYV